MEPQDNLIPIITIIERVAQAHSRIIAVNSAVINIIRNKASHAITDYKFGFSDAKISCLAPLGNKIFGEMVKVISNAYGFLAFFTLNQ
jgi:hypothetical protein